MPIDIAWKHKLLVAILGSSGESVAVNSKCNDGGVVIMKVVSTTTVKAWQRCEHSNGECNDATNTSNKYKHKAIKKSPSNMQANKRT
jgi:hypothetical protein